jgi:hypothetical protein
MKKILLQNLIFFCILFLISQYAYSQDTESDSLKSVTTVGVFDGVKTVVGNFETAEVYVINGYCIAPSDISDGLASTLKGKKVRVTGKLKIVIGKTFPAKTSTDGTIFEPYIEPDKKYISEPSFSIVWDN